jgi:hypothetical protein
VSLTLAVLSITVLYRANEGLTDFTVASWEGYVINALVTDKDVMIDSFSLDWPFLFHGKAVVC